MLRAQESLADGVVEKRQQVVVVAGGVEQPVMGGHYPFGRAGGAG